MKLAASLTTDQWNARPVGVASSAFHVRHITGAIDREEALQLELRGPNGAHIETESIAIIDTHYLLSLGNDPEEEKKLLEGLTPEEEAEIEAFVADWEADHPDWAESLEPEEETEFPRYQIQVQLIDEHSVP